MGQAVDQAGNIWETDEAGNAVRLIQAAGGQGRMFTLPPSPKEERQEARAAEDQQLQRENAIRSERAADRADKTAQRVAAAAERQANTAAKPTELQSKSAGFLGRMMQAEQDFAAVPEAERGGRSLPRQTFHNVAPGLENTLLNSAERQKADQAVENFIAASLRQESGAAISAPEFERQYKIFFPAPGDTPEVIAQKAAARQQAIGAFRLAAGPLAEEAAGTVQAPPESPASVDPDQSAPGLEVATGRTRNEYSPRQSAMVDAMINAGASKAMIDAALKKQGFGAIRADDLAAAKRWMKDNPGKRYFGAQIERPVEMSAFQQIAGSAPAAGFARGVNAATAGTLGALSGEQGQGALDAMASTHPNASIIGDIAGSTAGMMGGEAALAARAPAALARYAPRIADFLYGGLSGFNQAQEGEGLQGAALGAGAGLAGGLVGERALRGLGAAFRGVRNPAGDLLRDRGVPLTVGQAVGNSGRLGATVKNVEDALTSVPGLASIINARRTEGLEAFNEAAMRQAGAPANIPVTASGAEGMEQLRRGIGPAYDNALGGAQINTQDPNFLADLQGVVTAANAIPPVGGAREAAASALDSRLLGATDPITGIMPGRGFQEAYRGLGRTSRERAGGDYGYEIGQVMRQGQDTLANALDAQNPGALEAFRSANAVNRNANIIAQALDKAKNQGDELFTPAQINTADAMAARRLEGPMASAAGDRPFFDLARAGQQVLPSRLPDSGTATRGIVGAGLVGGALGGGTGAALGDAQTGGTVGLGTMLLLAAGGSKPAQKAMTELLIRRPEAARSIGDIIARNAGIGGWSGAGVLTPLVIGAQN